MQIRSILIARNCDEESLEEIKFENQEIVVSHADDLEAFHILFLKGLFDVVFFDYDFLHTYSKELSHILSREQKTPFIILNEEEKDIKALDLFFRDQAVSVLTASSDPHEMIRSMNVSFRLRDLTRLLSQFKEDSFRDLGTGLYKTTYLEDRLSSEFHRAQRYVFALSVVLISFKFDPEHFFDQGHNYAAWEKKISEMLLRFTRTNDIVVGTSQGRFLLLFPDTNKKGAEKFANRFLEAVCKVDWHEEMKKKFEMKTSMGIASFPEDGVRKESALLELADKALEQAMNSDQNEIYSFQGMDVTGLKPGSIRQVKPEG